MANYFVPCSGKEPVAILVNGHRLVLMSKDKNVFEDELETIGADRVQQVKGGANPADEQRVLSDLARKVNAGVVIAPSNVELNVIIKNLESQLPWLQ